jgi:hypothetical protein
MSYDVAHAIAISQCLLLFFLLRVANKDFKNA